MKIGAASANTAASYRRVTWRSIYFVVTYSKHNVTHG